MGAYLLKEHKIVLLVTQQGRPESVGQ